jgi:hypothetical protein
MENIDIYLSLIASLMGFYLILLIYLKYFYKQNKDQFTPTESKIPDVERSTMNPRIQQESNIYETEDTRQEFYQLPPVNPMVRRSKTLNTIQSSPDLFTDQPYDTDYSILDVPPSITNELVYSGGQTSMIEIPLQMNYPNNDEQLRSQKILVTPYNKIKYGTC